MIRYARRSSPAWALMATVALSGCTVHQRLATQAVNFNLAVEKAQNEMLLLNVIRAQDRMPMYLTGMSGLTGNVQTTFGATAGGSYSRARGGAVGMAMDTLTRGYMPSATASESENPTYTLTVLDNQEFMRGFMSPLGKDLFAYYWNQGWPPSALLYLLVERIEIERKDAEPVVLENYPESMDLSLAKMSSFGDWIQTFLARNPKPKITQVSVLEKIGPPIPDEQLLDIEKLVKFSKEQLVLAPCMAKPNRHRLERQHADFGFTASPQGPVTPEDPCKEESDGAGSSANASQLAEKKERMVTKVDDSTVTFILRSPEALLYYLGELARVANREKAPTVPEVCIQHHFQPLFVAYPDKTCPNALLSAESARGIYSIPAVEPDPQDDKCDEGKLRLTPQPDEKKPDFRAPVCVAGRSMQSFRLLTQVMSLQKSAKDNPSPALVRVIGQ
ncbi:MAG TPA: hypothetical protein VIE43_08720 [Thermoanaerobaculia bacterium]|jgi:hypothetical protein|nr:hypothetical protein [Thermoanaerobaculia bacterium]